MLLVQIGRKNVERTLTRLQIVAIRCTVGVEAAVYTAFPGIKCDRIEQFFLWIASVKNYPHSLGAFSEGERWLSVNVASVANDGNFTFMMLNIGFGNGIRILYKLSVEDDFFVMRRNWKAHKVSVTKKIIMVLRES